MRAQGSATLSMAYAGALFADACLRGLNGEPGVEEYTYVESSIVPGLPFFSSRVKLGPNGAPTADRPLYCLRLASQGCPFCMLSQAGVRGAGALGASNCCGQHGLELLPCCLI
jgi:hypothetical protein